MDERRMVPPTRSVASELARANFTTVRRGGLDPNEVRLHVEAAARELTHLENRVRDLQDRLADAEHRAANPTFDEATLASALGAQSAAILRSAHEEAGRVTAEAQERAAQLFAESQQRAGEHLVQAQERATALIAEAEQTAQDLDEEARSAAQRLIESAKVNGEALVERAREQGRAIVEQSTEARRKVLNDLAVKRKALTLQIEQLRAARDTLADFVAGLRTQVDDVLVGLNTSDEVARQAAVEALRVAPATPEPSEEELLAGTPLREVPDAPDVALDAPTPTERRTRKRPTKQEAEGAARPATAAATSEVPVVDGDEPSGTDVVNEIFARLRAATLEERGATATAPKRPAPRPASPDNALFAARDEFLDPALATLTKRVKRTLQDDQNLTLERLRGVTGIITDEMEDEHTQRARYAEAAYDALVQAASAGVRFAQADGATAPVSVSESALHECAADLAVTIVLALRKRILSDGAGTGDDRANAAYREWRGARVERLCVDFARRAFHLGVVSAAGDRPVHFVVAPGDPPCDACALDARSGERSAGSAFPSGAAYPPLHAGCACTVVPG